MNHTQLTDAQLKMIRRTLARLNMADEGLSDFVDALYTPEERGKMGADHSIRRLQHDLREEAAFIRNKYTYGE